MSVNGDFVKKARHRILIQKRVEAVDSYGASTLTWTDYKTVWAQIEPWKGYENFKNGQMQAQIWTRMVIRHIDDIKNTAITSSWRVKYDDRIFSIIYLKNLDSDMTLEGKWFQEIVCGENNADNTG